MALNLFDPFNFGRRVQPNRLVLFTDPFERIDRSMGMLDRFFDNEMNVQVSHAMKN